MPTFRLQALSVHQIPNLEPFSINRTHSLHFHIHLLISTLILELNSYTKYRTPDLVLLLFIIGTKIVQKIFGIAILHTISNREFQVYSFHTVSNREFQIYSKINKIPTNIMKSIIGTLSTLILRMFKNPVLSQPFTPTLRVDESGSLSLTHHSSIYTDDDKYIYFFGL